MGGIRTGTWEGALDAGPWGDRRQGAFRFADSAGGSWNRRFSFGYRPVGAGRALGAEPHIDSAPRP